MQEDAAWPVPVPVWDLATRLFHWSLAALVLFNLILGGKEPGLEFVLHVLGGYLVGLLLLYRFVWGLIGSPHSRFRDFVAGWPVVKTYAGRLIRFDPPRHVGHNPLGGWMIVLLLATLSFIVFTGLFGAGRQTSGSLAAYLPLFLSHWLGELHELASDVLWGLIGIHVAGVLLDWLLTRENIVWAMIKGDKQLPPDAAARELPLAGHWRAIALAVVMIALFGAAVARTDFSSLSHPQADRQSSLTRD